MRLLQYLIPVFAAALWIETGLDANMQTNGHDLVSPDTFRIPVSLSMGHNTLLHYTPQAPLHLHNVHERPVMVASVTPVVMALVNQIVSGDADMAFTIGQHVSAFRADCTNHFASDVHSYFDTETKRRTTLERIPLELKACLGQVAQVAIRRVQDIAHFETRLEEQKRDASRRLTLFHRDKNRLLRAANARLRQSQTRVATLEQRVQGLQQQQQHQQHQQQSRRNIRRTNVTIPAVSSSSSSSPFPRRGSSRKRQRLSK